MLTLLVPVTAINNMLVVSMLMDAHVQMILNAVHNTAIITSAYLYSHGGVMFLYLEEPF